MTTMYTQVVLPQATDAWGFQENVQGGISYAGLIPATATLQGALYPLTWNPQSANAPDRTIYVPDTAGTLSLAQAQQECYGLAYMQQQQIATLYAAYQQAIQQPVSYTSKGGVTKTYQADPGSVANLQNMLLAFSVTQTVPSDFYWVAADNTQVPFTYADLQGLMQAIGMQAETVFQHLQTLKNKVRAATTVAAVQAITW
jgi:hypothetical protein